MMRRSTACRCSLLIVVPALVAGALAGVGRRAEANGAVPLPQHQQFTIRNPWTPAGTFSPGGGTAGIAVQQDGSVVMLDPGNHRVQHADPQGKPLRHWGGLGLEEGRFFQLHGVAVAPDGSVYLADHDSTGVLNYSGPVRVQRFGPRGEYVMTLAMTTTVKAVGWDGNLFSIAQGNYHDRVLRHGPAGDLVGAWDGKPSEPFGSAIELAASPSADAIHVADSAAGKIQVFTADGRFVREWVVPESGGPKAPYLYVATAGPNRVWVARFDKDDRGYTVTLFAYDPAGTVENTLNLGRMQSGIAMAGAPDGTVFLILAYDDKVRHLDISGQVLAEWGSAEEFDGPLDGVSSRYTAADGGIVQLRYSGQVTRFGPLGEILWQATVSEVPSADGPIALANDGTVTVCARDRIDRLGSDGLPRPEWPGVAVNLCMSTALAPGPDGSTYAFDHDTHLITRYHSDGAVLASWGGLGEEDGKFPWYLRLAADPDGSLWAMDWYGPAGGEPLARADAPGQDSFQHRVQHFGADGTRLGGWPVDPVLRSAFPDIGGFPERRAYDLTLGPEGWPRLLAFAYADPGFLLTAADRSGLPEGHWPWPDQPPYRSGQIAPADLAWRADGTVSYATLFGPDIFVLGPQVMDTWRAAYFQDRSLANWPSFQRLAVLDMEWQGAPPVANVPAAGFGARFERGLQVESGRYRFDLRAAGGVRLWVGQRLLVDHWEDDAVDTSATIDLAAGEHRLVLEYADGPGNGGLHLSWTTGEPLPPTIKAFLPLVLNDFD
jgi:outer membrane protein assembly factor BamB